MTNGVTWTADYVASFDEKAGTLDLQGWVTLTNDTNIAFENSRVRIAGRNLSGGGLVQMPQGRMVQEDSGANSAPNLFDLPEAVTIADRQAKQISMVELKGVPAEKVYRSVWRAGPGTNFFSGTGQPAKAEVTLRFETKDKSGSSWRLPQGAMRSFIRDAKGDAQFVGESRIGDIAAGGKVQSTISRAFDIEITPRLTKTERFGDAGTRNWVEYKVTNASAAEVSVEVEQGGLGSDARAFDESVPGVALDAYRRQWTVKVPAHGEAVLTAVLEQGR
jgi:hypothetical protein